MDHDLTKHAKKRLKERTSLSVNAITKILDKEAFLNIGSKSGTQKEHLLFIASRTIHALLLSEIP